MTTLQEFSAQLHAKLKGLPEEDVLTKGLVADFFVDFQESGFRFEEWFERFSM